MVDANRSTMPMTIDLAAATRELVGRLPPDFADPSIRIDAASRIGQFIRQQVQQQQANAAPATLPSPVKPVAAIWADETIPRTLPAFADFQADLARSGDPDTFDRHWSRCGNDIVSRKVTLEQTVRLALTRETIADVARQAGSARAAAVVNRIFASCELDTEYRAVFQKAAQAALGFLSQQPPAQPTAQATTMYKCIADRTVSRALAGLAARMEPGDRLASVLSGGFVVESAAVRRLRPLTTPGQV